MKHTEGEWFAAKGDVLNDNRSWGIVKYLSEEAHKEIDGDDAEYPSRTEVIAEVCAARNNIDEGDAHLMAAAPDMLHALTLLMECVEADWGADFIPFNLTDENEIQTNTAVLAARKAINKALGAVC